MELELGLVLLEAVAEVPRREPRVEEREGLWEGGSGVGILGMGCWGWAWGARCGPRRRGVSVSTLRRRKGLLLNIDIALFMGWVRVRC